MTEQTKINIVKAVEKQTKQRVMILFPDDTAKQANPRTVDEISAAIMKEIQE